ncbi:phosphoglycolate phosphatase [Pseudidiomarina salinarum]|uniref:Phosphoglycolate phosphatase n=1 Tax=Pseudidiomarina salinarum TaxID=435908 RepID=A0A094J1M7_9GAMM|nr:HAD-IA family hydrolase [Pseudidiomarina salinarum]KFZ31959.1 phosphoglycolate phosphatase [Pseudidiomarina salinarum]RUO70264.1 phosphoglycolate phosphatase [Pseudidiomarina salinarum]
MLKPTAILFDLDGTLLDTAPDLGAALNTVLRSEQRAEVAAEAYTPLASHGSTGLLRHAYGKEFDTRRDELREAFLAAYAKDIMVNTRLYQGVNELIKALAERDIAVGIVTNKPLALTRQLLPHFPDLSALKAVVCGDTLQVAKPRPEPLLHAAELLGVQPHQCWYVGDAQRDIEAGLAAKMFTVLARYGYLTKEEQTADWGADAHIEQPLALLDLLEQK